MGYLGFRIPDDRHTDLNVYLARNNLKMQQIGENLVETLLTPPTNPADKRVQTMLTRKVKKPEVAKK